MAALDSKHQKGLKESLHPNIRTSEHPSIRTSEFPNIRNTSTPEATQHPKHLSVHRQTQFEMAVGKLSQLQLLAIVITALLFLSMYSLRSAGNPLIMPDTSNTTSTHLTGSSTLVENATLILAEKLSSDSKELETTTISWNHIFNNKTRAKMLETMDNEADRKTIYDKILNSTVKPSLALRTFATPSATRLLSLAIVEPRSHPNLRGVLYNIAHTYGGTEAVLYIFHGIANADHVRDITKDWVNVQLINMDIENLPTRMYFSLSLSSSYRSPSG